MLHRAFPATFLPENLKKKRNTLIERLCLCSQKSPPRKPLGGLNYSNFNKLLGRRVREASTNVDAMTVSGRASNGGPTERTDNPRAGRAQIIRLADTCTETTNRGAHSDACRCAGTHADRTSRTSGESMSGNTRNGASTIGTR
jgi:hypothetical protein